MISAVEKIVIMVLESDIRARPRLSNKMQIRMFHRVRVTRISISSWAKTTPCPTYLYSTFRASPMSRAIGWRLRCSRGRSCRNCRFDLEWIWTLFSRSDLIRSKLLTCRRCRCCFCLSSKSQLSCYIRNSSLGTMAFLFLPEQFKICYFMSY